MSDRGPYDSDPDPTEVFPPLRNDPTLTPPAGLPPLGADRDPDPTRVMPPTQGDVPTTAVPSTGGPYQPGPPFGGPPGGGGAGGGGGGDEPLYVPEPDPWYRQPGPLAALIAGIAAVVLGIIALVVWTGGDDDGGISGGTLPSLASTTTTTSSVPDTTTTSSTVPDTTTTTSSTTTSTSTTTTTTTTVPETTTTTTTLPPTTTTAAPTTPPPPPPPPGQAVLDAIRADAELSTFADALACTGLDQDVLEGDALTVLAPANEAFADVGDPCGDPDAIESILLLHLVSVDLTYQQIFAASELQTLGELVTVSPNTQTIGSNESRIIERDVRAGDGILHVLDKVIVP